MEEVSSKNIFSFRASDDEVRVLNSMDIGFSEFVHQSFKWARNGRRYSWIKDMTGMLLVMVLGLLLFCLALLAFNLFLQFLLAIIGLFMTVFGTMSIWCEWRKHGRIYDPSS